jgi:DinB family protein
VPGETTFPDAHDAIARLQRGDRALTRLLGRILASALTRRGIGGGDWSPVDLVGHLESWERHALGALEAWSRRERAPIDVALEARGLDAVNAEELAAVAGRSPSAVLRRARDTHAELVDAIRSISDDAWRRPPLTSGRWLGQRLGGILGGPAGPFLHVDAHLPDLRAFVAGSGA